MNSEKVRLGESSISGAGRGVYALCDFKIGDDICYYDGIDKPITSIKDFKFSN